MPSHTRVQHWSFPLGRTAFGMLLLGFALIIATLFNPSSNALAAQVRQLKPTTRTDLLSGDQRGEILIEGRISRKNEVLAQSLVAYQRTRAGRDSRNDIVWSLEDIQNPPLQIDLADGSVIVAGNYSLLGSLLAKLEGDYRYEGFAVGDSVLVIGEALPGNSEMQLSANYIMRGTRAEYTSRSVAALPMLIGLGMFLGGAATLSWLLWRGNSPFPNRTI